MDNVAANIELFKLINSHHNPTFDIIFQCIRWLGTGYFMIPLLIFAYIYQRRKLGPLFLAFVLETGVVHHLKNTIDQPRPAAADIADYTVHLLQRAYYGSFPSGDVAMAAAIAFVMTRGKKAWTRTIWYLYVLLIAYERMYMGVHFPIDVLAGAVIGAFCAWVIWSLRRPAKPKKQESQMPNPEKELVGV